MPFQASRVSPPPQVASGMLSTPRMVRGESQNAVSVLRSGGFRVLVGFFREMQRKRLQDVSVWISLQFLVTFLTFKP